MVDHNLSNEDLLLIWVGSLASLMVNDVPEKHNDPSIKAIGDAFLKYECSKIAILWEKNENGDALAQSLAQYLSSAYPDIPMCVLSTADADEIRSSDSFITLFCLSPNPPEWLLKLPTLLADGTLENPLLSRTTARESDWSMRGFIDSPVLRRGIATLQAVLAAPEEYNLPKSVLLTGETGVGKTRLAELLAKSVRPNKPYIHVNCASLPPQLADSMIFGSVRGAFTGAVDREGFIEAAGDGILFLDELGELPLETQAHLLTMLERRSYPRFGSTEQSKAYPIACRFIFGTNKVLSEEVKLGRFREDLLRRINGQCFEIPPLRDRLKGALGTVLIETLVKNLCEEHGHLRLTKKAQEFLIEFSMRYNWPGNIREFKQVIQNLAAMSIRLDTHGVIGALHVQTILKEKSLGICDVGKVGNSRELKDIVKMNQPARVLGEIDLIFKVAAECSSCADAGKAFFNGGRKMTNYSDAFGKRIKQFGLRWAKDMPGHLIMMRKDTSVTK